MSEWKTKTSKDVKIFMEKKKFKVYGNEKCDDCNGNGIYLENSRTYCNNKGDKCWTCNGMGKQILSLSLNELKTLLGEI